MCPTKKSVLIAVSLTLCVPLLAEPDQLENASSDAALERVKTEIAERNAQRSTTRIPEIDSSTVPRARFGRSEEENPVYRNGVPYYDEWTIRVGATRLRVPGYDSWRSIRSSSDFFDPQANAGLLGDRLAFAMFDKGFVDAVKTKFVSFFTLIWVPDGFAFKRMTSNRFHAYKEALQEEVVAVRRQLVNREDFEDFDDYRNFKFGRDEQVEDFIDGYMIRAVDSNDLVMYFATSEFIYKGNRAKEVAPMIVTVTYALVENKLVRIDMKRLFTGKEDVSSLIEYSQNFVDAMRRLNAPQKWKSRSL